MCKLLHNKLDDKPPAVTECKNQRKEVIYMLLSISLVDREGNKKAMSVQIDAEDVSRVPAFVATIQTLTGCKVLGYSTSSSVVILDGALVEGEYDLVGEVANLRFKDSTDGRSFVFKVPGALNAYDDEEEVNTVFASEVKTALETLYGAPDTLQYRGGSLVVKNVSNPVKMPDLGSEE